MNRSNSEMSARRKFLKERILQMVVNQTYTYDEFLSSSQYWYISAQKEGDATKDKKDKIGLTKRQIEYDITLLKEAIRPRYVNFVKGGLEAKDEEEHTAFGRRKNRSRETKENLGRALWDVLLGTQWRGHLKDEEVPPDLIHPSSPKLSENLEHRIKALRRRNQLYFAADAGSTTLALISVLLETDRIPLEIRIDNIKTVPENYRIIEPVLLTNSFPIAEAVQNSGKHRYTFTVEFIGGIMRPGRNCTTGELTSVWLHVCCAEGRIGTLDLAIVGVTGVTMGVDGVPIVACDDAEEAALKRKFLSMAGSGEPGSGIRVMIFHAAKLLYPEARCRFGVITKSMVDLVVVNVGEDQSEDSGSKDAKKKDRVVNEFARTETVAVQEFVKAVTKLGVDVLVIKEPSSKDAG